MAFRCASASDVANKKFSGCGEHISDSVSRRTDNVEPLNMILNKMCVWIGRRPKWKLFCPRHTRFSTYSSGSTYKNNTTSFGVLACSGSIWKSACSNIELSYEVFPFYLKYCLGHPEYYVCVSSKIYIFTGWKYPKINLFNLEEKVTGRTVLACAHVENSQLHTRTHKSMNASWYFWCYLCCYMQTHTPGHMHALIYNENFMSRMLSLQHYTGTRH